MVVKRENLIFLLACLAFFALVRVILVELVFEYPDELEPFSVNQALAVNVCGSWKESIQLASFNLKNVALVLLNCTSACLERGETVPQCVNYTYPPTLTKIKTIARDLEIGRDNILVLSSWGDIHPLVLSFGMKSTFRGTVVSDPLDGVFRVPLQQETENISYCKLEGSARAASGVASTGAKSLGFSSRSKTSTSKKLNAWFQSIPLLFEKKEPRKTTHRLPFDSEIEQRHPSIVLLVITCKEQIKMVNAIHGQPFDGFFSSANSFTLVSAASELWRSGAIQELSLWNAPNTFKVPLEEGLGDSPALLELQGLSYVLLLKESFSNVIVFPYNRLPLRLWSEIQVVSFGTQKTTQSITHWHNNAFVNNLTSDEGSDMGRKTEVFSILRLRDQFGVGSIRGFLFCSTKTQECYMDAAKSLSWQALENLFVQRARETASVITRIFENDPRGTPSWDLYTTQLGSFFSSLFPEREWSRWVHLAPLGPVQASVIEQLSSPPASDWMFTSAFSVTGSGIPIKETVRILQEMNTHRENMFLSKGYTKECVARRFQGSGNLGLHPATPFNNSMLQEGEEEFLEAKSIAQKSFRERQSPATTTVRDGVVFVAIIHLSEHIDMLAALFVENENNPNWGLELVVVPEKRMFANPNQAQKLYEFSKHKKVHVIPERLALIGVWAGPTLVYKELIGYIYAATLFPTLSHVVLMSADSIPLKTRAMLPHVLEPDTSYFKYGKFHAWRDVLAHRIQRRYPQCGDAHHTLTWVSENPLPDDIGVYLRKHSQWKVLSGKHIQDVLLAKDGRIADIVEAFHRSFKFGRIPDEHWLGSLFHYLFKTGLIDRVVDREVVHEVWRGGGHPQLLSVENVRENRAALLSGSAVIARKVQNPKAMVALLNVLFNGS